MRISDIKGQGLFEDSVSKSNGFLADKDKARGIFTTMSEIMQDLLSGDEIKVRKPDEAVFKDVIEQLNALGLLYENYDMGGELKEGKNCSMQHVLATTLVTLTSLERSKTDLKKFDREKLQIIKSMITDILKDYEQKAAIQ